MKCLILLGFLALSFSLPFQGRHVDIKEDGTITITKPSGKKITISKNLDGKNNIDICISGADTITKKITIDETNQVKTVQIGDKTYEESSRDKRSTKKQSQAETLYEIFKDYKGPIDEETYKKLLKKVEKAAEDGKVNPVVLAILEGKQQLDVYETKGDLVSLATAIEQKPYNLETLKPYYPVDAQKPYNFAFPPSYNGVYEKSVPIPIQYPTPTYIIGHPINNGQSGFSYQQQPFAQYAYPQLPYHALQQRVPIEDIYEKEYLHKLLQQPSYVPAYSSFPGYTYNPYHKYQFGGLYSSIPKQPQTGYTIHTEFPYVQ